MKNHLSGIMVVMAFLHHKGTNLCKTNTVNSKQGRSLCCYAASVCCQDITGPELKSVMLNDVMLNDA